MDNIAQLKKDLKRSISDLGFKNTNDIEVSIPEKEEFGDYTTNLALQQARQKSHKDYQSAKEIASDIVKELESLDYLSRVEIAGPGFINFWLKDEVLIKSLGRVLATLEQYSSSKARSNTKKYLVEYAQPNTHKPFHIGHLRNIILGESIARLLEERGHEVFRATYDGDIGLHVAKAIWGVIEKWRIENGELRMEEKINDWRKKSLSERAKFLGEAYVLGVTKYEEDEQAKKEIDELNLKLYTKDPKFLNLWNETKKWSLDSFEELYSRLGTKFDRVFLESEVGKRGIQIVEENIVGLPAGRQVFIKDQGAIIFPGEKYGLHNRVFITGKGTPTYEAKELGLTELEYQAFAFDESLHVVANEQSGYFEVVIKALEQIYPNQHQKKRHLSYGFVKLKSGKMSSRTGVVVTAEDLITDVRSKVKEIMKESNLSNKEEVIETVSIGAIKFSMLKYSCQSDITFDINESVSLHGDSGPYVQYTFARIKSVLSKIKHLDEIKKHSHEMDDIERSVARYLDYFDYFIDKASASLSPTSICEYLLQLSKSFNFFYQKCPILQSNRADIRVALTAKVGKTLEQGLYLLGIKAPERM